ncbi:hypothetical protein PMAG_a1750 [Pseudoalteromonas mariniglutinosa NCIMB 1770]|nr:hypothetical protein [Pseudoalteromonas mariniglutinosa NCIMB 1770]
MRALLCAISTSSAYSFTELCDACLQPVKPLKRQYLTP